MAQPMTTRRTTANQALMLVHDGPLVTEQRIDDRNLASAGLGISEFEIGHALPCVLGQWCSVEPTAFTASHPCTPKASCCAVRWPSYAVRWLRAELKADIAGLRVTTQRWMSGVVAANTIALVTALVT